jgi:cytochrome bd ubiquinol oxidase subunit II
MAKLLWPIVVLLAVSFLAFTWFATPLWHNVLAKPYLLVLPLLAVAGLFGTRVFAGKGAPWKAWFASSAFLLGAVLFGVAGLFPNMLPSSLDPAASVTAFNAASSALTLKIMLGVVLCFLPVVIGYQFWVYRKFRDVLTEKSLSEGMFY